MSGEVGLVQEILRFLGCGPGKKDNSGIGVLGLPGDVDNVADSHRDGFGVHDADGINSAVDLKVADLPQRHAANQRVSAHG